jgi:hypothetical protein
VYWIFAKRGCDALILRKFFQYNRNLLSKLCKAAADSLQEFLSNVMGVEKCIFGAVMTIQVSEERDSGLSAIMPNGIPISMQLSQTVYFTEEEFSMSWPGCLLLH